MSSTSGKEYLAGATEGEDSSLGWEPPSTHTKPPRRWLVPVVVVVVVLVVVAGLAASGELPGLGSSPHNGATGPDLTFAQAEPLATRAASSHGGTTRLSLAVGIVSAVTYTAPLSNLTGRACLPSGGSANDFTVPAYSSGFTSGKSPAWFFEFWRSSPPNVTLVEVLNGTAVFVGSIPPYPACGSMFLSRDSMPGEVADSPQLGASVAANATPFLAAHPAAIGVYALLGGNYSNPYFITNAIWKVGFSTCALGQSSSGTDFNASLNVSTADLLGRPAISPVSCSASAPILGMARPFPVALLVPDAPTDSS